MLSKQKLTKIFITLALAVAVLLPSHRFWQAQNTNNTPSVQPTITANEQSAQTKTGAEKAPQPTEPEQPSQSIVLLPDEASLNTFINNNDLQPDELKASPQLASAYIIDKPSSQLNNSGAQVVPRLEYRALLTPNDPIYPQWYTEKIAAPAAWDVTTGSSTVTVAVIDTGFALSHEDLAGRWAVGGKDFANNDNDPSAGTTNPNGAGVNHGTMTAGLVGATGNNGVGVASVNWGAKILPLQALDDDGSGYTDGITAAVNYAVAQGAKVISMSLGGTSSDPLLQTAVNNALSAGVSVVAAAGNCGDPTNYQLNGCSQVGQMLYPAKYAGVIAVGASDQNDARASFSSYGPELSLLAPGAGSIRTTDWSVGNQTALYSNNANGTSFATPVVAGLVGMLKGTAPALTVAELTNTITTSADKVSGLNGANRSDRYGYGRLNAFKAIGFSTLTHPDGTQLLTSDGSGVYVVQNGQRSNITSGSIFSSYNFDWNKLKAPMPADNHLALRSNMHFREGTLLENAGHIYVADTANDGTAQKRGIASWDAFVALGYSLNDVLHVGAGELPAQDGPLIDGSQHPDGSLIYTSDRSGVIVVINAQRHPIISGSLFTSNAYQWSHVRNPTVLDNLLAIGSPDTFREGTLLENAGHIYVADTANDGTAQKRGIASWDAFVALGYSLNDVLHVGAGELPAQDGPAINL